MGNGLSQCLLCGESLGLLGSSSVFCQDCKKVGLGTGVCSLGNATRKLESSAGLDLFYPHWCCQSFLILRAGMGCASISQLGGTRGRNCSITDTSAESGSSAGTLCSSDTFQEGSSACSAPEQCEFCSPVLCVAGRESPALQHPRDGSCCSWLHSPGVHLCCCADGDLQGNHLILPLLGACFSCFSCPIFPWGFTSGSSFISARPLWHCWVLE